VLASGSTSCHELSIWCVLRRIFHREPPFSCESLQAWRPAINYTAVTLLLCNVHRNTFAVLLPQICSHLSLSPSQAGMVQASNLLAYLLGQLPSGRLADKLSGTAVLILGLLVWSVATTVTGLPCMGQAGAAAAPIAATSLQWAVWLLMAARALMGLASAAAMPCVTAISAQQVPASSRGSAVSFVYSCFNLGECSAAEKAGAVAAGRSAAPLPAAVPAAASPGATCSATSNHHRLRHPAHAFMVLL